MSSRFYQPTWGQQFAPFLTIAESRRNGGVSTKPYQSLNLGLHTEDDIHLVQQNRALFCESLGWKEHQLAGAFQTHGDQVLRVHRPGQWEGYDAFMTNKTGILLSVTVADCTPILIYDAKQQAVGAAHAGWRGTVAGIGRKLLQSMRDAYDTKAADCWVYIGTCIGTSDFEVDSDVADHFTPSFKSWDADRGKFLVDLKAANAATIKAAGVPEDRIECSPFSTVTNNDQYFSHRAEKGKTGRMLAVIGLADLKK